MQYSLRHLVLVTIWAACAIGGVLRGFSLLGGLGIGLFAFVGLASFAAWCWLGFSWSSAGLRGRAVAIGLAVLATYPLAFPDAATEQLDYLARSQSASELTRHMRAMLAQDGRFRRVTFTIRADGPGLEVTAQGIVSTQADLVALKNFFSSAQLPGRYDDVVVESP